MHKSFYIAAKSLAYSKFINHELPTKNQTSLKTIAEPSNLSWSSSDSETPILFLDVNFGNGEITRIVMYENDKPEELAEAFWVENGLDLDKKDKLVKIIYEQFHQSQVGFTSKILLRLTVSPYRAC